MDTAADAMAVRCPTTATPTRRTELTYRELDEESSRLARYLIAHGAGPGDFIAVAITRSVESVLAVWAVAKTGAAYVPIDPTYPPHRIAFMLANSGVTLGITVSAHRAALGGTGTVWIELDDPIQRNRITAQPAHPVCYLDRLRPLTSGHIAYVIFTSGSTGRPKGVAVTHEGLAGLVEHEVSRHKVTRESRIAHLCSPSFDVSVLEMLLAFSTGATLVVVPPTVFGGASLTDLLEREQVTHLCVTPSVLESLDPAGPNALKSVICAGERLGSEAVTRWARADRSVHNLYGPTEATIIATGSDALGPGDPVHIGTAVPAMGTYVLDPHLRPVPEGVIGELYLTGPALALGYLHRPALTAERFLANPFPTDNTGARMYRTGDLVRRTPAGALEYHGRADSQVKIRGLRIELDEIDNTLAAHPDIDYAITVGTTLPSGTPALVSYVLPRPTHSERTDDHALSPHTPTNRESTRVQPDIAALTEFLAETLPASMLPTTITVLDELPLTPVGKLDRAALPEPVLHTRPFRTPDTPIALLIAETFAAVLSPSESSATRPVGADDNFFDLGGNSLLAAKAAARIADALGLPVPVSLLFDTPVVTDLAERLVEPTLSPTARLFGPVEAICAETAFDMVLPIRTTGSTAPLFCVHPVSGMSWPFAGLSTHLSPRHPIYGLQSPVLATDTPLPDSIEEWAAHYVRLIRATQPRGPYHVLGWSFGGVLAHEIAVQLQGAGERIDLLAIMDGRMAVGSAGAGVGAVWRTQVLELLGEFTGTTGDWTELPRLVAELPEPFASLGPDRIVRLLNAAARSMDMRDTYHPSTYHGDVVYFTPALDDPTGECGAARWAEIVAGTVHDHAIPTTHDNMASTTGFARIAEILMASWNGDRADVRYSRSA